MKSPQLLYICDWLPPDFGAVGQYALAAARERAGAGAHVVLIGLASSGTRDTLEQFGRGSLLVRRLKAPTIDRSKLAVRLLWTLLANFRLLWHARRYLRADEILFTGSPPLMLLFIAPLNLLLRRQLTYRITDFYPECYLATLSRIPLPLLIVQRLTWFWRRRIHKFEALGVDQRRRLVAGGIKPEKIILRRDGSPVSFQYQLQPMIRPQSLAGKVILLYSGNFGVAHDHQTFIAGYTRHHREGSGKVVLWLNALGKKADIVESELRRIGLPVHRTQPVPLAELAQLLVSVDAHLISLRDEFVGFVLPSKVYACIASGRQILYIGSQASDVYELCQKQLPAARFWQVDVGASERVAAALEAMAPSAAQDSQV